MFILKNALKCTVRAKGRNILIGIIALVISVSACIGLSIRQASESAKKDTLEGMSVSATISFDRQSMMSNMGRPQDNGGNGKGFNREDFMEAMGGASSLTLEEYQKYSQAESVKDFYYTLSASFNGSESFEPVSTEEEESTEESENTNKNGGFDFGSMPNMMGFGGMGSGMNSGDFTVIGYSGDNAMTSFIDSTSTITQGSVFEEATEEYSCIISEELAVFNDIEVGDTITLINTSNEEEVYELTVVGIYNNTQSNSESASIFSIGQDPANQIYMSSVALQKIIDYSSFVSQTVTDEDTGREYETEINGSLSATYVFADTDAYYQFEEEVRTLGLDESYTVSSSDLMAFESSLTPLNTLSTMAGWFLVVILIIGAVILIVLNIFNVRERKYEIGVLTAMGMKKGKVALQFIAEILIVTMIAVILGAGIGAVSSLPVTNALLENQIQSQQSQQNQMENSFGRPGGNMPQGSDIPDMDGMGNPFGEMFGGAADYITEVNSAMNFTVVLQMLGIGLLLTLAASAFSILFVMRYDPLKILANRD